MKGIRLNVAVEQDDHSFLKLTIKVRSKIVADGLNDDTFDVTNKGIHLKAKEFNELLEDPNTICGGHAKPLRKRNRAFSQCHNTRCGNI